MKRLTHERANGIKTGYWSPAKKQELVDRLARYENIGIDPDEIQKILRMGKRESPEWIPVKKRLPKNTGYILLSFKNFSVPMIGRYEEDSEGGAFYLGDEMDTCVSQDLFVNAWRPLPEPYNPKGGNGE